MRVKFILICMVSLVITSCTKGPEVQWEKFTNEAFEQAAQAGQPTVVYFYAAWCRPCQMLKANVFTNEEVVRELEGWRKLKADVSFREKPENIKLNRKFGIRGLPTVIFFNTREPGKEVARFAGLTTAQKFIEYIHQIS